MSDEAVAAPASGAASPTLDDLMVAMDVVDTLRHDERLVARELSDERDEALIDRLREIYKGQGIDVSDEALAAGVKALKESRFVYTPVGSGFKRVLAMAWVRRGAIGAALLVAAISAAGAGAGYYQFVTRPAEQAQIRTQTAVTSELPRQLAERYDDVMREAKEEASKSRANDLRAAALASLSRADEASARRSIDGLGKLLDELRLEYVVRIVNRKGEPSGIWRRPKANPKARNYYLIVEAITPDGQKAPRAIESEETGEVSTVTKWAQRVSEATYQRVVADKSDDGIIQQNIIARKKRGYIDLDYAIPVSGGAITQWNWP